MCCVQDSATIKTQRTKKQLALKRNTGTVQNNSPSQLLFVAVLACPGQLQRHAATLAKPQQLNLSWSPTANSRQHFKQQPLHEAHSAVEGLDPAALSWTCLQEMSGSAHTGLLLVP